MHWRCILIVVASLIILFLSGNVLSIILKISSVAGDLDTKYSGIANHFSPSSFDFADSCYPFKWQEIQQEHLRYVLQCPDSAPVGTDNFSNALYLLYAKNNPSEKVYQEGIRREPENALYQYMLADMHVNQGLSGRWPKIEEN